MAILHQHNIPLNRQDAGLYRELDAIDRLQQSLPDNYEIFHSINWFSTQHTHDQHGEIDVVVMSPEGNLLLLEIKAGEVILRNGEIYKNYHHSESNVSLQCKYQYSAVVNRLTEAKLHPYVTNCLVLPDYKIADVNLISYTKLRIIAAEEYDFLGSRVLDILKVHPCKVDVDQVRSFLNNEFKVTPDLNVLKGQLSKTIKQLSEGMANWVPRISAPSGIVHIKATAGSGKTQLALRLLNDAAQSKHKSLYVCFNRTLADHISKIAPVSSKVTNFHELCIDQYKRQVGTVDFSLTTIFELAVEHYLTSTHQIEPIYDLIVIDEAQDFQPDWISSVTVMLKPEGKLYLMEDPDQCLYPRDNFDIADSVVITCDDNYRSPQSICQLVNAFSLASSQVVSHSPYKGDFPEFYVYADDASIIKQTEEAIEALLEKGFELSDIVVLTGRGRVKSKILSQANIGKFMINKFTGRYTEDGEPIWSNGDIRAETVYRFKGQSSPAIVFTEIEFEEMTDIERNKLFVGITRAQMAVELVLSTNSEQWFSDKLNAI